MTSRLPTALILEDDVCDGLRGGVGDAESDVFYAQGVGNFPRFAMQSKGGAAAAHPNDFDIDPAHAAAPACAQGFHRRFFGGKTAGVTLVFIFDVRNRRLRWRCKRDGE